MDIMLIEKLSEELNMSYMKTNVILVANQKFIPVCDELWVNEP